MGGVVGFTLREEDGTEHRMSRWTNWTPWAIDNINLVKKSPEHIEKILFEWKKYNNLPEEQKKEYWAFSSPYLAPAEYGLVVVDMLSNKILDCNCYHTFGFINQITLTNEFCSTILDDGRGYSMPGNDRMKAFTEDKGNTASRFYRFFKEKRIKDVLSWNEKENKICSLSLDINSMNDQELEKIMSSTVGHRSINDNPILYAQYQLDMSPFEVITFPESKKGFEDFRQAVLDLGFSLSEEEEQLWKEYIERFADEEDDN